MKKLFMAIMMAVMLFVPSCNTMEAKKDIQILKEIKKETLCSGYAANLTIDKVLFIHIEPVGNKSGDKTSIFKFMLFPKWVVEEARKNGDNDLMWEAKFKLRRIEYNIFHGAASYSSKTFLGGADGVLIPPDDPDEPCSICLILTDKRESCGKDSYDTNI